MASFRQKPLREQVMVITGASSGIGLATAKAAAREGARLVLAARNEEALQRTVVEIRAAGGDAIHVVTDVAERPQLEALGTRAIEKFGRIDTWVNNAGLSIWGRLEEVGLEDHRRLFEVNFWGVVNGSLIAARHMKASGGTIINLGSVVSDYALPIQGMYTATKHAVKAFTDALRMEFEEEKAPLSVTLIKPSSIDTDFPHHARNYTDREPVLPPPIYAPEEVAMAILHAATHPVRDIYIGTAGAVMGNLSQHAPRVLDWLGRKVFVNAQLSDEPPRDSAGALHKPGRDGRARGDHKGHVMKTSLYTRASLHPAVTGAAVAAGVGLAAAAFLRKGRQRAERG